MLALKLMKNYDEFKREITARFISDNLDSTIDKCVVKVLGWHLPNAETKTPLENHNNFLPITKTFSKRKVGFKITFFA